MSIHTHTHIYQYNLSIQYLKCLISSSSHHLLLSCHFSPGIFPQSTTWSPCCNVSSKLTARVIFLKHKSCSNFPSHLSSQIILTTLTLPPIPEGITSSKACTAKKKTQRWPHKGSMVDQESTSPHSTKVAIARVQFSGKTRNQCFDMKCLHFFKSMRTK